jgi:hypothetical protein
MSKIFRIDHCFQMVPQVQPHAGTAAAASRSSMMLLLLLLLSPLLPLASLHVVTPLGHLMSLFLSCRILLMLSLSASSACRQAHAVRLKPHGTIGGCYYQ